jgi:dipeptidyl aminopeptidase/acylaminoacyl peptidase
MRVILIFLLSACLANLGWAQKRLPVLKDIYQIKDIAYFDISPDGEWVVYTVNKMHEKTDKVSTNLWMVNIATKKKKQLTFSKDTENYLPVWSPDGQWIAYLSDETDNNELWLYSVKKGKSRQLTHLNNDISEFTWSPDSKNITFSSKPNRNKENQEPIVINRYEFKSDEDGYLTDLRNHIYVFNIQNKKVAQLTTGEYDEYLPTWSPDGKYIAYVSKRDKDSERSSNYDIYIIKPQQNSFERKLTHFPTNTLGPDTNTNLAWSPDSSKIAYLSTPETKWSYYAPYQLTIVDLVTGKQKIIAPKDQWFSKPLWSPEGESIYALVEGNRNTYLSEINPSTGVTKQLTHGLRYDKDYAVSKNKIVLLSSDDQHPPELFLLDESVTPLTHQNKELTNTVLFQPAEDFSFKNSDGVIIDGLLIKPLHYLKGKKFPAILYLHGGPVDQFSHAFDFDLQWFAANGYIVIAPNPRGSSGKGLDFSKAIYADWGHHDVKDVLQSVNYLVAQGIVDPHYLAVGGWSYGGMLTNYVIASDQRFKAALSGAASGNILSNYGADQYTYEYEKELGKPWQAPETYLKLSYPFMKSNKIRTPTLFMCGQLDFNVPCEGSEQLYQALRSLNTPTQLVIYPEEHHILSTPTHITDSLKRTIDWLNKYLNPSGALLKHSTAVEKNL